MENQVGKPIKSNEKWKGFMRKVRLAIIMIGVLLIVIGVPMVRKSSSSCNAQVVVQDIGRSLDSARSRGAAAPRLATGETYLSRVYQARAAANDAITSNTVDESKMAADSLRFHPGEIQVVANAAIPAVVAERSRTESTAVCQTKKAPGGILIAVGALMIVGVLVIQFKYHRHE